MKNAFVGVAAGLMIGIEDDAAQARSESSSLTNLSLSEVSQLVRTKKVSPVEVTKECLSRIERLNLKLNAFITVTGESALAEARQAEAEIQRDHWRGPLHGIPIALKDLVDTAGVRTTARVVYSSTASLPRTQRLCAASKQEGPCSWGNSTCTSSPTAAVPRSVI
jgi:Asp-tRNA(Asn)/Glu-tRNA(Gln) amidotransferase A subunit family amidase